MLTISTRTSYGTRMVLSRFCKGSVAARAGWWLLSVVTVREISPLVSAIRKGSLVVTIEIIVVPLREVSRPGHTECFTKCCQPQQCLTGVHWAPPFEAGLQQLTDDFSLWLVLLL